MEKCIFRDNDLIYKFQSGFLPGCSTTHHLVHLYHSISEGTDKGLKVQMVFGDISKAFDTKLHGSVTTCVTDSSGWCCRVSRLAGLI